MLSENDNFFIYFYTNTTMDKTFFYNMGLNERETEIYLALLKERECNASALSKITQIHRTTVYLELDNLIRKGIVSYIHKNSKKYFRPCTPEKFLDILDERKNQFEKILPTLNSLQPNAKEPSIEVYEGIEGMKVFYEDIITTKEETLVLGSSGKGFEMFKFYYPKIIREFEKKKFSVKLIANDNAKEIYSKQLKTYPSLNSLDINFKFVSKKYHTDNTSFIVFGETVAIQNLEEESIYVILIKHRAVANSFRKKFYLIWDSL